MLRIPHCLDNRLTVNSEILREREREKGEVVVVRDTTLVGGDGNIIFCLKVPRQCPLVLLIGLRFYFKVIEVGEAALERNLGRHYEAYIRAKF
jgi:hypothetical protein